LETVVFRLLTDVCRPPTVLVRPERPLTVVLMVDRLLVMPETVCESVLTVFCRLATAVLAAWAALDAAWALLAAEEIELERPLTVVVSEPRELVMPERDVVIVPRELVMPVREVVTVPNELVTLV